MDVITFWQDLLGQAPQLLQPVVIALAGAVPFVEGEGAVVIGVLGGLHPVVAGVAAALGNFAVVALLVLASARTRRAVTAGRSSGGGGADDAVADPGGRSSARRAKFQKAYERYGVPGVSLLGPLLLPTHFTATMLAATGVGVSRVLLWQAVAIVGWTTLTALIITGVISVVA
ncbi:small multidrug efflux protein [Quadrisphaera sp. INWT6]|uniref:small multidrug efflux protein n=1 Tax=Quadrisphaera sp. INWT6 TaxID=2596917 RepID=UPI0018925294|nr:small multidrug efflux protein [Quadrisphaera sp. INWT6]MBF5082195.1 small multidrug efflux protein [Quadrisphaera sp. INWT6]